MSHVAWPRVLPLALRLHVAQAILASEATLEQYEADPAAQALLDTWALAAGGQLGTAGRERRSDDEANAEGPAIDAYFDRVGAQLQQQAVVLAQRSTLAGQLFEVLQQAHGRQTCIDCCTRPAPQQPLAPCRWTRSSGAADAKAMDDRGGCIVAVRDVFRFAAEVACQAYEEACGAALKTRLNLHTGHGPRNGELDLAVNAETTEHPNDELHTRNVRFVFHVDSVFIDDLHAMAYIALHECVAHGYCGVNITEPEAAVSVPFHEGWMDAAAAYVLSTSISCQCDGYALQYANGFQRGMAQARTQRYNRNNAGRSKDIVRWTTGRQAYEAFERLARAAFEHHRRHAADEWGWRARELVAGFSLALNASDVGHLDRAALCAAVNRYYGAEEEPRAARQRAARPQVLDFIDEYADSGDFRCLVARILAIV